ncbi:BrnT family toxin [Sulfuriferula sp.]|uniref:BrnT family toxin n=1 Tax=Sulfuriferula sp. TaxID=2025307 RepID=UPI002731246A|nr:BrnT family toxin [Sulfuriferula sp.]MDP2026121.1 BrnT family toxin [Sulfuriferula sp.]
MAITYADPDHSIDEHRFLTFGLSHDGLMLVISHTEAADGIRIISARKATREEQKIYAEEN